MIYQNVHADSDPDMYMHRIDGLEQQEVLYADDTLLLGTDAASLQSYLACLERQAKPHGLHLNRSKCVVMSFNSAENILYGDGAPVPKADSTEYLGAVLTDKVNINAEISKRIQAAAGTW